MSAPLVRGGVDAKLEGGQHTAIPVLSEMLAACMLHYPGLPDPRTLDECEIRTLYGWLRPTLHRMTAPSR